MLTIKNHFITISAVFTCALLTGCNEPPDRYTAEESGYLSRFEAALSATCSVGGTKEEIISYMPVTTPCNPGMAGGPAYCPPTTYVPIYQTVPVKTLSDAGVDAAQILPIADKTLAPEGLTDTHRFFLDALRAELKAPGTNTTREAAIKQKARATCSAYSAFATAVQARTNLPEKTDSVYLAFKPNIGVSAITPQVRLDSRDGLGFSISQSISVPTPLGNITLGYEGPRGVHFLRIAYNGKERLFKLDRPFEFYMPPSYGTKISYDGGDELLLTVIDSPHSR